MISWKDNRPVILTVIAVLFVCGVALDAAWTHESFRNANRDIQLIKLSVIDLQRVAGRLIQAKPDAPAPAPSVANTKPYAPQYNDFVDNQQLNLASDQYIKDHTRILGDKVGFSPTAIMLKEWRISRSLWDRYTTRDIRSSYDNNWGHEFSLELRTNPRAYSYADAHLMITEASAKMDKDLVPADCDVKLYSENHRKAVSYFTQSVEAAGCQQVKEVIFPITAGCSFISRGQTSIPGGKAYLYYEPVKMPENEDDRWYNDAMYGSAKILFFDEYLPAGGLMRISSSNAGRFSSADEEKRMKADWQQLVNDITKNSVSSFLDEYGACY